MVRNSRYVAATISLSLSPLSRIFFSRMDGTFRLKTIGGNGSVRAGRHAHLRDGRMRMNAKRRDASDH